MTLHHVVRTVSQHGPCIYCNRQLDSAKWVSAFCSETHYKSNRCECGKHNFLIVGFAGTGHDSWSGLEKRVNGKKA